MDEWDIVRQKIKDLQNSILTTSSDVRNTADTISVADYWKRRYEQEQQLWEQKLAVKEKEQTGMREKFVQDEQGIRDLNYKLKELETRLQSEKSIWEERSKIQMLEAELEKKKIEWGSKIRMLEEENEQLRGRLRKGAETVDEEKKRRQEMETEKIRMEEELKHLQQQIHAEALEEQKKMQAIETEKQTLQKQLEELKTVKEEGKEKSAEIQKELEAMNAERNRNLALLTEREKEQFEAFEILSRGFAHKVRNYLGIMGGTMQLCLSSFKMEDELKKQIVLVDESVQEMLKAIEEFLSLAKIPEMHFQGVDVNELLSSAIFMMEDLGKAQNIRFEKKFTEALPPLSADAKLLVDGVKQIIANAIESSPAGSAITVSSGFEPHSNKIVIRIIDTGKGISENQLKRIFQPYFTTKKGKKGLGLSIAKRAIDLHHGSLTAFSAKDQGTTMTIQIPITKPA